MVIKGHMKALSGLIVIIIITTIIEALNALMQAPKDLNKAPKGLSQQAVSFPRGTLIRSPIPAPVGPLRSRGPSMPP